MRAGALIVSCLIVATSVAVAFGASQMFTNNTGGPVTGIQITFSDMVWIASYDKTVFPVQDPVGVVSEITFSGGQLANLGQFVVAWGEAYASVISFTWIASSGIPSNPRYPTVFGIDYSHPAMYLTQGEQSLISDPAMFDSLRGRLNNLAHLGEIYRWLHSEFEPYSTGGATIGKVTVDQVLASRRLSGCHDFALVYAAVARELGYPALMVDTANVGWISRFRNGEQGPLVGHVFVEVFLIDRWILIDSTSGQYLGRGYDPAHPIFSEPGEGYYGGTSTSYCVMWKGADTRAYGINSNEELHCAMESFAQGVSLAIVAYPAYIWQVFAR
jgi:Transglutaminase-like superfamily